MGGIKVGGMQLGTTKQLTGGLLPGSDIDTSIKDPAGMQQYTDLANQAQQEYTGNRKFLQENVDPQRKNLLTALADQASGKAPSVAEAQLKSAFDTSLKNQLALARSNRGGNAGLAARNISNVAAQQQQNLAQQGAIAKLQERQQAQNALSSQIKNEQDYGVDTLSAALGSQANVATMQNAQRDRNDKRNKDILGGVMDIGKSIFSGGLFAKGGQVQYLAEGGQVKSKKEFYKQLKACGGIKACGGKVQKKAQGGAVDVGDVSAFAKGASDNNEIDNSIGGVSKKKKPTDDSSKGTAGMTDESGKDMAGMADLDKVAFMAAEGGQVNEDQVQKVSEMEDEIAKKIFKEKGSIALQKYLQNKKRLPAAEPQQKAEGGQILPENMTPEEKKMYLEHGPEAVENSRKNKKMRDNMFNLPDQDYKAEGGLMMKAGGVPGTANHAGDNYQNDKVPAMLSPGEVVVPRSVIADGPKAAAIFVEKASKDKNYNAENYAQERPSFIKALGGMKKKESDYENFKKMIRGR